MERQKFSIFPLRIDDEVLIEANRKAWDRRIPVCQYIEEAVQEKMAKQ